MDGSGVCVSIHLALLVIGGILAAVAGDWLGHRLGRRRISLFRLRPRYSGLLATGVAGGFVGLLVGLSLWGLGAIGTAPKPIIATTVPGPSPDPDPLPSVEASATIQTVPEAQRERPVVVREAAKPPPAKPVAEAQSPQADRQIPTLLRDVANRPLATASPLPAELVARRGETLCLVEAAGGKSADAAYQTVAQVLGLVERLGVRRGAASGLQVPVGQLELAAKGLQEAGAYRLQIVAARHSALGEPLAVQVSLDRQPIASLADMQERERLDGPRVGSLTTAERVLAPLVAGESLEDLPPDQYVTLPETIVDPSLQVGWHDDATAGGPIRLQIGADE